MRDDVINLMMTSLYDTIYEHFFKTRFCFQKKLERNIFHKHFLKHC